MKATHLLSVLFVISIWSCNQQEPSSHSHAKKQLAHWGYEGKEGPEKWDKICKEYSACGGKHQSPINIMTAGAKEDVHLKPIKLKYNTTHVHIINNGHTVQFNCDEGSFVEAGDKEYSLKQFHFHTPSEHEVNGDHYPMEAHFVHQAKDGTLAVVGVLFKEGAENHFFKEHLKETPHKEGKFDCKSTFDLHELLPEDASYYHYDGSLTTPPCSEIVSWYVMDHPIEISKAQADEMHEIMHDNFRPVQPINDRVLVHYTAH